MVEMPKTHAKKHRGKPNLGTPPGTGWSVELGFLRQGHKAQKTRGAQRGGNKQAQRPNWKTKLGRVWEGQLYTKAHRVCEMGPRRSAGPVVQCWVCLDRLLCKDPRIRGGASRQVRRWETSRPSNTPRPQLSSSAGCDASKVAGAGAVNLARIAARRG